MAYPISMLMARLQQTGQDVVSGCYTPATLAQLSQSLSRIVFTGDTSIILAIGNDPQRAWADLAMRGLSVAARRVDLSPATGPQLGFALIGVGQVSGFVLAAAPIEPLDRDESLWLYDALWSCDPAALRAATDLLRETSEADISGAIDGLTAPPPESLLRLSGDLLDFAARQHSTLGVTNRSLAERMRNQEDQTRMIVHDMRAPLHTLLISIKALQRQRFDPEGRNELLEVARDSAGYLLNLTETVLDSARLETSGWAVKRQPVRILNLVQSVCDPLELAARPDQAQLHHSVADDMPVIWVDRALMERVLTNLLTNAIKYTPASGQISVSAQLIHDGHAVEISVLDTGHGISQEAQAHIFERFYQANDSDRRRGTGLGLYFCRLAVEAHGGSIDVRSAVGEGSTFIIVLPVDAPKEG
ncbi:HAMP domain-containing histidine kinase [Oscillochloris sp. ZM17-4]|uniref:sensor histidine kinase n=1 Tax=Oscillochloris sp. ZM17-4 TaxID=2866714 RepID=UPI001C7300CC|nr:HAMP domain-containing sensor histidine kinase [Oscillochloris sp. ZM17-4]MBX0328735.1 HAMP domain-containing histidine kinase [Oscillochloris sp. ZM17-4]